MTPNEIIDAAESGNLKLLRKHGGQMGVAEAFFRRIAALLGDDPTAASELGSHWRMFLKWSDRPDFVWRGRGAALRASGKWAASARALLKGATLATSGLDKAVFAVGAIDSLARSGQNEAAIKLGRCLCRKLRRLGSKDWEARARLNLANAYVWQDRYREAARQYRLARAGAPTDFERASATLGLSTSLIFSGSLKEAVRLAEDSRHWFAELGLAFYVQLSEINLAHVALIQGTPEDAWDLLRRLQDSMASEADRGRIVEFLGDALAALGLYEQALSSYQDAEAIALAPLNVANAWFGMGRCYNGLSQPQLAQDAFRRSARLFRRVGNDVWHAAAALELARIHGSLSQTRAQSANLKRLGSSFWRCEALLLAAELGDREALSEARKVLARRRYLGLRWKADWLLARKSGDIGHYRRMAQEILVDRLATRSLAARMGFLRDKRTAIQDYLGRLIDSGTPTAFREAVEYIKQTRSASLIDELVAQPQFEPIRDAVERFRASLVPEDGTAGARRVTSKASPGFLQGPFKHVAPVSPPGALVAETIWIDLGVDFGRILPGIGEKVAGERIRQLVGWLEFEMTAPMLDREASPQASESLLRELATCLGYVGDSVCPDGALWQVPWGALSSRDPIVLLNPSLGGKADVVLPDDPRVLIWHQERGDLPWAQMEVRALIELFPNATVCRTAAEASRSLDGDFDLVHVAAHCRVNIENPMFSFFEFDDGPLFAVEVARSRLKTRATVLAGCETGKIQLAFPDEPDGFVRAFLARGSHQVVAGLWPLDDEASYKTVAPMMIAFSSGRSLRDALQIGKQACKASMPHPYFWGAFSLFGGYCDAQ